MNRNLKFWLAVFLALGSLISFGKRSTQAKDIAMSKLPEECTTGITEHFKAVWKYVGNAAERAH